MDTYTRNQGVPRNNSFKPGQSHLDDYASWRINTEN
jgi:hypothetical protein